LLKAETLQEVVNLWHKLLNDVEGEKFAAENLNILRKLTLAILKTFERDKTHNLKRNVLLFHAISQNLLNGLQLCK